MSDYSGLIVGVLLLFGNAFFVGAEFAIISARRAQIELRAEKGSRAARTALAAMERVSLMLASAQLGITMCSLGLGAVAEPALAHLLEPVMHLVHLPSAWQHPVSFVIALTIVVYLHIVLGEMVPKNLALAKPEVSALVLATPLVWVTTLLKPFIVMLNWGANVGLRMAGVDPKDEVASAFTADEVQSIVDESAREGLLGGSDLLTGALEFSDRQAGDLMVTEESLITVDREVTAAQVEDLVAVTGFSRFPVAGAQLRQYVHLKDVLGQDPEAREQALPEQMFHQMVTVQRDDEVEDALTAMQRSGSHLARVLHGDSPLGVLFLEDVLEELVGEISDAAHNVDAVTTHGEDCADSAG